MSTNSTTRATQSCDGLDTICLSGLCRENEAYFNGLIYLVNNKFDIYQLTEQQMFRQVYFSPNMDNDWTHSRFGTGILYSDSYTGNRPKVYRRELSAFPQ
ncbi:hypothetical protein D0D75_17800 [Vibrio alginolyticus]|nr:hypothetical protein [Vibrio alginolyticus]